MKSYKLQRVVLRAILVSTIVCAINMNIITNKGTFSMFTSGAQSTATIKTADAGDLIKEFNIVEEYGQQFIVIEPGEFLKDNSIVYFEVTGEAAAYIMHIDPVELLKEKTPMNSKNMRWNSKSRSLSISKNKQYFISNIGKLYIPIYVNVNIWKKLSLTTKNDFKGNITLRYLNGFIKETKSVTLSSSYLNSRWASGTDYYFWEKAKNTLSNSNSNALAINKLQDDFYDNFQKEFKKIFNETLDNEQIEIIDSIADGYREHVSNLEMKNKELLKLLEELQKEKEKLIGEIDILMKQNGAPSKELQSKIETLKAENKLLVSTIEELKKTINSNTKETTNPPKDNKTDEEVTVISTGSSDEENKVTDPAVISGTENEVIDLEVTNNAGNEKNEE